MIQFLAKSIRQSGALGCSREFPRHLLHRIATLTFTACTALFTQTLDATTRKAESTSRPNLVLILADDLGYGDLSCYGCPDIATPHLDRLASQGIRFTDFYANAAVCSPTRIALLTGRYHQRLGIDNALYYQEMVRGLPPGGTTIATALRDAGYATGVCGKWHVGYDLSRRPLQQGFDHFFGLLGGNHHYFAHMDRIGVADLWLGNAPISRTGYSTDLVGADAIAFVESHQAQPFFLYVAHPAPHFPWQGPDDAEKIVEPKHKSWQQGDRETYAAMVRRMDDTVGELMAKLDELNLRDSTLVVFTSDIGGHTHSRNEPLRGEKATIWEGGTRVPCIARLPGVIPSGTVSQQVGITMDWTATFRRLAGIGRDPQGEDGIDLLPRIVDNQPPSDRTLFWRRVKGPTRTKVEPGYAVRSGRWKLIRQDSGEHFLFDLTADPGEGNNLWGQHPGIQLTLLLKIRDWQIQLPTHD